HLRPRQIECVAVLPPVLHRDERLPGLVLDRPFRMLLPQSRFLTNQKRREPQPRLEPSFVYPLHEPPQPMRKLAVYAEPVADVSLPAVVDLYVLNRQRVSPFTAKLLEVRQHRFLAHSLPILVPGAPPRPRLRLRARRDHRWRHWHILARALEQQRRRPALPSVLVEAPGLAR